MEPIQEVDQYEQLIELLRRAVVKEMCLSNIPLASDGVIALLHLPPLNNLKAIELDESGRVRRVEHYASGAEPEYDKERIRQKMESDIRATKEKFFL